MRLIKFVVKLIKKQTKNKKNLEQDQVLHGYKTIKNLQQNINYQFSSKQQLGMQNDQCVYSRSLLDRLNSIMQGSGNLSQFEDIQLSNSTTNQTFKLNSGLVLMVVMMVVVGLMAIRNRRKQPESKLE